MFGRLLRTLSRPALMRSGQGAIFGQRCRQPTYGQWLTKPEAIKSSDLNGQAAFYSQFPAEI